MCCASKEANLHFCIYFFRTTFYSSLVFTFKGSCNKQNTQDTQNFMKSQALVQNHIRDCYHTLIAGVLSNSKQYSWGVLEYVDTVITTNKGVLAYLLCRPKHAQCAYGLKPVKTLRWVIWAIRDENIIHVIRESEKLNLKYQAYR